MNDSVRRWVLSLAGGVTLGVSGADVVHAQARRPLRPDDMYRLRDVGAPRISPDGAWVAYTVTTIDSVKDSRDTDVWMVNWAGDRTIRLTSSPDDESQPRWSPDNRYLSFVSGRFESKGGQLWLLDRSGGEAERLTTLKGGVSEYEWSPDGTRIAVISHDADPADSLSDSARTARPKPIVIDRYGFKRDEDGYLDRRRDHVWIVDVATRTATQLTTGDFDDSQLRWSPDGRRIAFVSQRAGPDPDRTNNSDVFVVDAVAGATPIRLTSWPGTDEGPVWSPDGRTIAYLQGSEAQFYAYSQNTIAIIPSGGGAPRLLAPELDRDVSDLAWSADGSALRFLLGDDRAVHLASVNVADGAVRRLLTGRRVVTQHDAAPSGRIVTLDGTASAGAEVHALENGAQRALTHVNDSIFSVLQLGTTEDISFRNRDGLTVNALLIKPADFVAGRKYPLVLRIHGGPNGQDEHLFDTGIWLPTMERQLYAAAGYAVLAVNYRGSSGRGREWKRAIFADWGNKEVQDLIAGVDHLVRTGVADPERLGIGGWSYGGILTDYTIASTTRFKAAISGAGSALQTSMYGTDQYVYQYENELGVPWKNQAAWNKVSRAFWQADRITTPTLFMGGANDFNVPISGSEQMFQALKSLGVDTQLIVYPDEYHGIARPSFVRDRLQRYLSWYDRYLKRATP
ncbi:MAG: S9 family peptidase [Gemmatimonadaceae bacterium]|nr:S9 family peptidase [Gemmatimonadaceae bacterium]